MKTTLFTRIGAFICACLLLTACATPITAPQYGSALEIQQEAERQAAFVLEQRREDLERIDRISFPLLTSNTVFCNDITGLYGFSISNIYSVGSHTYQIAAKNTYGLTGEIEVLSVTPKSPAAKTGLQKGDIIKAINGVALTPDKAGLQKAQKLISRFAQEQQPLTLNILRNGKAGTAGLQPVAGCAYPVTLTDDGEINAYADGKAIYVTRGMLRFARSDNELALVIAHELGHNALEHVDKKQRNALIGGLAGLIIEGALASAGGGSPSGSLTNQMANIGGMAYSVGFEQEADYIGMYMMARAGYDTKDVENFWRRMSAEADPNSINRRTSHPTSPERFVAIQKTHTEIRQKKSSGAKLLPNMKPQ